MHVCPSHHNDECSRAYEAPDKVSIQSQPAPRDRERRRQRETSRTRDAGKNKGVKKTCSLDGCRVAIRR